MIAKLCKSHTLSSSIKEKSAEIEAWIDHPDPELSQHLQASRKRRRSLSPVSSAEGHIATDQPRKRRRSLPSYSTPIISVSSSVWKEMANFGTKMPNLDSPHFQVGLRNHQSWPIFDPDPLLTLDA